MYDWVSQTAASVIVEIPYNLLGGTIYFLVWYAVSISPFDHSNNCIRFWVVYPDMSSRAPYEWLMILMFEVYFASFAQAVASLSPNSTIASVLFSTLFSFVLM